ncbi:MAG: sulfate adenylyltransferase [Rhodospirillaceae bacterium]|nr:sulfate adenylyltransferase [Rhodospirillaceae bacterium]|tara:strand:- start:2038 stop:3219 length:1182 start_codon:yes stop_codon:yes gene_type:complete
MIKPHGSSVLKPLYVDDDHIRKNLLEEAEELPDLLINSAAAANVVMLGGGYFTPLEGFMSLDDAICVAESMHTSDGLFWPVPIFNLTDSIDKIKGANRIALRDPNIIGNPVLAIMDIKNIEFLSTEHINNITEKVYGTLDSNHPGVYVFKSLGRYCVSGSLQVLNFSYFESEFRGTFRTAVEIRKEIFELNWKTVVAFQTRNPMHRAHEELCSTAMERLNADGLVIHMLLGKLKQGDIPASVRDSCIRKMVELYFPANTVIVNGYGFDMLYAGPREALLHALFRQNMGASHLIVGRDHAGVGNYYGGFDAQTIFEEIPKNSLDIEIFAADHAAYSKKLNRVVMMREVTDHGPDDYIILSGTRVRELLSQGIELPAEFSRPEVANILMDYYRSQ